VFVNHKKQLNYTTIGNNNFRDHGQEAGKKLKQVGAWLGGRALAWPA
jgi:hypothetical protein